MTAADRCRRNGWVVGTRLKGTEREVWPGGSTYECTEVIEITAIGEHAILAKVVEADGLAENGCEISWDLDDRRWRRVR